MSHTESFYKQLILKMSYVFKTYLKSKFQQNWTVKNWSNSLIAGSNLRKSDKNCNVAMFTFHFIYLKISLSLPSTTCNRNILCQKCESICGLWILMKKREIYILKVWKKLWELLNSTANPGHFHSNWTGLAVLFRK